MAAKGITFGKFEVVVVRGLAGHDTFQYQTPWMCGLCGAIGEVTAYHTQLEEKMLKQHKEKSPACDAILIEETSAP